MSKLFLIDLFCGAGGVTTGFEAAEYNGNKICETIACVNHDAVAIESHSANHPHVKHFTEDIRTLDLIELSSITDRTRKKNPDGIIVLWASLECTNFSKAKGGLSRKADSRMLGDEMYRYIRKLQPDYFMVENVEEFVDWGPVRIKGIEHKKYSELCVDKKGEYIFIPVKDKIGIFFKRWKKKIKSYGYKFDDNNEGTLNAADYGACQSRKRYFAVFAKPHLPIEWPEQTHAKDPVKIKKPHLKKWEAVRGALNLNDHGKSIFGRKKELCEKSKSRVYEGLIKHVAGGKNAFLIKYNSVNGKTGKHVPPGLDEPCPTLSTQGRIGLVTPDYLVHYRGQSKSHSLNNPSPTITTKDKLYLTHPEFLIKNFSGHPESKSISTNDPAGTVTTIDHHSLVQPDFLIQRNSGDPASKVCSLENPSRTVTATGGNLHIVQPQFMVNYHGKWKDDKSIREAAGSVTTKDDCGLITPQFIKLDYTTGQTSKSIQEPSAALTKVNKSNLVTCDPFIVDSNYNNGSKSIEDPSRVITANRKYHYMINPQWAVNGGKSIDEPCFTIIARLDKAPPYLITTEEGFFAIEIFEKDSYYTKLIKEFMALYGIIDIKMRMLRIAELLIIQGFPVWYQLKGKQEFQKKHIGNAVEVGQAKVIAESFFRGLVKNKILKIAA